MSLRTISLALISNGGPDPAAVVRYALDLTGYARAHLLVRIAVPPLIVPTLGYPFPSVGPQIQTMIEQEDVERREWAEQMASMIQMEAEKLGATATVEVLSAAYDSLTPHLIRMARGSDICIMLAPSYTERQQRDILLDLLFGSGGPLLLVPTNWKAWSCKKSRCRVGRQRLRGAGGARRASAARLHRIGGSTVGAG